MPKTACGIFQENGSFRFVTLCKKGKKLYLDSVRQSKAPYPERGNVLISGLDKVLLREASLQPHPKRHTAKILALQKEALFPLEVKEMKIATKKYSGKEEHYFFAGYSQHALEQHLGCYGFPAVEHHEITSQGWALKCFYHLTSCEGVLIYIGAKATYLVFKEKTLKLPVGLRRVLAADAIDSLQFEGELPNTKIQPIIQEIDRALERLNAKTEHRTYCGLGSFFFSNAEREHLIQSDKSFKEICLYAMEIGLAYSGLFRPFRFVLHEGKKEKKQRQWKINQQIKKITTRAIAVCCLLLLGGSLYENRVFALLKKKYGISSIEDINQWNHFDQEQRLLNGITYLFSFFPKNAVVQKISCDVNQCSVRLLGTVNPIKKDDHVKITKHADSVELTYSY